MDVDIDAGQSGYTLEVVQDARDYADHAGRTDIGMEDVRLAVRKKQDALSAGPPTREVRLKVDKRSPEDEITHHPIVKFTRVYVTNEQHDQVTMDTRNTIRSDRRKPAALLLAPPLRNAKVQKRVSPPSTGRI